MPIDSFFSELREKSVIRDWLPICKLTFVGSKNRVYGYLWGSCEIILKIVVLPITIMYNSRCSFSNDHDFLFSGWCCFSATNDDMLHNPSSIVLYSLHRQYTNSLTIFTKLHAWSVLSRRASDSLKKSILVLFFF